ncbi:MAG TPA: type 2 isopentenyl-diphosphate Delta-isomerase [Candidatus Dormibacteraeota bacterium]|nr:type 2 isopentenyl-diphosphate Delta-isomerase [Candidatus Dormibacteraeota bacterium]
MDVHAQRGRTAAANGRSGTTGSRKAEHIRLNLEADVAAKGITSGFEDYGFEHAALPEIDLAEVDVSGTFLSLPVKAPLLISCMTGGVAEAEPVNAALAEAAQALGIAVGLGSARVLLENPDATAGFLVRRRCPGVPLLANLGAVQLNRGVGVEGCLRIVDRIGADALVLHLNALQEAVQPGGDTCFGGLLPRIAELAAALPVPVVVKEVGWGIDAAAVGALLDAGVAAVDIAGAGGTSWTEVERHRLTDPSAARVAAAFSGWGIPTARALAAARAARPSAVLVASGGIRTGLDVATAIAIGADLVGAAGPFLRAAATGGPEAAAAVGWEWIDVLRLVMFCTGCADLAALRTTRRLLHRGERVRDTQTPFADLRGRPA